MYEVTKAIGINPKKYILASLLRFDIFDFILEINVYLPDYKIVI